MKTHPPVTVIAGDVFTHDVTLLDEETGEPWDVTGHTFSAWMVTGIGGTVIEAAAMTAAVVSANVVRIEMTKEVTAAVGALTERGVYYFRDDTDDFTIPMPIEALVAKLR